MQGIEFIDLLRLDSKNVYIWDVSPPHWGCFHGKWVGWAWKTPSLTCDIILVYSHWHPAGHTTIIWAMFWFKTQKLIYFISQSPKKCSQSSPILPIPSMFSWRFPATFQGFQPSLSLWKSRNSEFKARFRASASCMGSAVMPKTMLPYLVPNWQGPRGKLKGMEDINECYCNHIHIYLYIHITKVYSYKNHLRINWCI